MNPGASVALIFLIIQTIFAAFVILALFAGMVFLMYKLRQVTVRFMPKAQAFTQQVADVTHQVSDKVAAPFVAMNGMAAMAEGSIKAAWGRVRGK